MIRLPRFTLLTGPKGCGKSTLASLLQTQDPQLCAASFAEPIRMALLASFHPEEMTLGIDLRKEEVKSRLIPGGNITYREWMIRFADWMKEQFTPYIFVDLAKRMIESQSPYWGRFIFDDCRFVEEVSGIVAGYGLANVLVLHIEREGDIRPTLTNVKETLGVTSNKGTPILGPSTPLLAVTRFVIKNDTAQSPQNMVSQLRSFLGEYNEPPAPRTPPSPEVPSTKDL